MPNSVPQNFVICRQIGRAVMTKTVSMMASSRESPSVRGTNRKWYMAVSANWSRDSDTMSSSMTRPLASPRSTLPTPNQAAVAGCGPRTGSLPRSQSTVGLASSLTTRSANAASRPWWAATMTVALPALRIRLAITLAASASSRPGRRLVQQPHGRRLQHDARQRQAPRLAAREPGAAFAQARLQSAGQAAHLDVELDRGERGPQLRFRRLGHGHAQVLGDAVAEELRALGQQADARQRAREAGISHKGRPPMQMRPAVGSTRPAIMASSVDLPEPLMPVRAMRSPGSTVRSRPARTGARSAA